jgi:hypothetical protein
MYLAVIRPKSAHKVFWRRLPGLCTHFESTVHAPSVSVPPRGNPKRSYTLSETLFVESLMKLIQLT